MIVTDDKHLLMIEPQNEATKPIRDLLTSMTLFVVSNAKPSNHAYKGIHRCVCGEISDNRDWILPNGMITNSLAYHYITQHRAEVPEEELDKLRKLYNQLRRDDEENKS